MSCLDGLRRGIEHRFSRGEILERESDRLENRHLVGARASGVAPVREIGEIGRDVALGQGSAAQRMDESPPSASAAVR